MCKAADTPPVCRPTDRRWSRRCRDFHGDTGGQISLLVVFGAVALVGLLGMVMTTGDQVSQKIQMQNSVDAAALSGGAWIARGLNVTSAFNLMQTQLVGGAILLRGLDKALPDIYRLTKLQNRLLKLCLPKCAVLYGITEAQLAVLPALRRVVRGLAFVLADCKKGVFWWVAKGLEKINGLVHLTFVGIANFEAFAVAAATGAEGALLVPGPFFNGKPKLTMPTKAHPFPKHCDPMVRGSRKRLHRGYHPLIGYPIGEGPYTLGKGRLKWLAMAVGGLWPPWPRDIFYSAVEREKRGVCRKFGTCGSMRPEPYLLDTAHDGLSYLAIAYKPNRKIFFGGSRIDEPSDWVTYAQVEIYNGVNGSTPDAYTQDWRVRLAPASLIERPFELFAQTSVGSTFEKFAEFALRYLGVEEVDVGDYLWQVGNH